jgi:hypothetical protein
MDEGLNQHFNSLDAQRDAGAAYIRSQAGQAETLYPVVEHTSHTEHPHTALRLNCDRFGQQ